MTVRRMVLVAILALGGTARAQDACRADVEKLCADVPAGGGRIWKCLKTNEAKVSPPCKQHLAAVSKRMKGMSEACQDDVSKFCATVKPGQGAVLKCLSSNRANLSPGCQEVVQRAEEKTAEFKKACGSDAKKLCPGVPPGQGRILACLESKRAELSPACQAMMPQ